MLQKDGPNSVNIDYHVEVERHYYSVRYRLSPQTLDIGCRRLRWKCFSAAHGSASLLLGPNRRVFLFLPGDRFDVLPGSLALMVLRTRDALGPLDGYGIARRIEQINTTSGSIATSSGAAAAYVGISHPFML